MPTTPACSQGREPRRGQGAALNRVAPLRYEVILHVMTDEEFDKVASHTEHHLGQIWQALAGRAAR